MRPPGATAEVTRRRVTDAAVRLFAQKGYAATGIRELAAAAGLTGPALYHYVGTKEDLLVTIMRSTIEPLIAAGRAAINEAPHPSGRLAALVELHVWLHATRPMATLIADTELRALGPDRRREIVALRDRYQSLWRSVVHAGRGVGEFDVADERVTTIALLELATGVTHWYRPGGRMALADLCAIHADLALALVRARRGRRAVRREDLVLPDPADRIPLEPLEQALHQ
jgi:AcrR family transcriptional regulator